MHFDQNMTTALTKLREQAEASPIDVGVVLLSLRSVDFVDRYNKQITTQTITVPGDNGDILVQFSVEKEKGRNLRNLRITFDRKGESLGKKIEKFILINLGYTVGPVRYWTTISNGHPIARMFVQEITET